MSRAEQSAALAARDPRQFLSKSFMVGAELCGERAHLDLNRPRPFRMNEAVLFGKAIDVGVEALIESARKGTPSVAFAAHEAELVMLEHDEALWPAIEDVDLALKSFLPHIEQFDMVDMATQPHIRADVPGIDMTLDCHPDLMGRDGSIIDIKTARRAKEPDAAARSYLELGAYVLAAEAASDTRVGWVAYMTWVRTKSPYWQIVDFEVTDEFRRRAKERIRRYADAVKADVRANAERAADPINVSFPNGPAFPSLCGGCAHAPKNGGACTITEEV